MLALNTLIESADCVLPVDNQALFEIVSKVDQQYAKMQAERQKEGAIKSGTSVLESGN